MRDWVRRTIFGTAVVLVVGATAGCANPLDTLLQEGTENAIEGAVENNLGEDVDLNVGGGASLPDSWPSEVPVPGGEVLASIATGDGMMVTFGSSAGQAEEALSALAAAGFSEETRMETAEGAVVTYTGSGWNVVVTVGQDTGSEASLVYVLTPIAQ